MLATRRDFLKAGGLALAGLAGLPVLARRSPHAPRIVEIAMRSDPSGADVWFDPLGIHIQRGDTVRWIVSAGVHTTTAYHPVNGGRPRRIPEAAAAWDSGYLVHPGDRFEVTFTVEGVYDYFCAPHEQAGMVGRIVVGNPAASPARDLDAALPEAARVTFPAVERIMRESIVQRSAAVGRRH